MDITKEANSIKESVDKAKNIAILLPDNASRDSVAAGLSLYLSLIASKKKASIVFSRQPIVGWSHLVGVDKITQTLGGNNFVISLDYQEGSIEKVSYNIEGNKFNLVIEPRAGALPFDEKKISYSKGGFTADMIMTLAAPTLQALGKLYSENQQLFQQQNIIAIDPRNAAQFGKVNLARPVSSSSELVAQLIKATSWPVDVDICSNLYDGIISGTRNFTIPTVNADTFEIVAWLLRQGARKKTLVRQEERPVREVASPPSPEGQQPPPDWLKQPKVYSGSTRV